MISLLGIPWDGSSSYMQGAADAPPIIRRAILSPSSNLSLERGGAFLFGETVQDLGDLDLDARDGANAASIIRAGVDAVLDQSHPLLCLGGDHSITWPILKATAPRYERLTILHFDAHPDLYPDFEGDPYSHACPFARIMENFDHVDLFQIGIRTMNDVCRSQVDRFNVRVRSASEPVIPEELHFDHPVYISLDLDVLDPAFAPGVSHHEPGGLSTRELLGMLHSIKAPVVGADLVEYNPHRDLNGMTAMVAAKLTKELAGLMLHSPLSSSEDS